MNTTRSEFVEINDFCENTVSITVKRYRKDKTIKLIHQLGELAQNTDCILHQFKVSEDSLEAIYHQLSDLNKPDTQQQNLTKVNLDLA